VVLSGVTRHFGRFVALRPINESFAAGRLYAILGENGAGKSTLLRVMAGLLPPSRGTLTLLGTRQPAEVRARCSYMAHASLLYDELDAMENLRYFAGLYGIRDDSVCQQAIRTVHLDPVLRRRVGQYSQGMRQRLSLARAILHEPELLLLDEPFSNVDADSARAMVQVLEKMRDRGCTLLVVTHQASLLVGVADEFVRMAAGRIIARTAELEPQLSPGSPVTAAGQEGVR
jgi:ABC-type multidrug transport system ATPase subunit